MKNDSTWKALQPMNKTSKVLVFGSRKLWTVKPLAQRTDGASLTFKSLEEKLHFRSSPTLFTPMSVSPVFPYVIPVVYNYSQVSQDVKKRNVWQLSESVRKKITGLSGILLVHLVLITSDHNPPQLSLRKQDLIALWKQAFHLPCKRAICV